MKELRKIVSLFLIATLLITTVNIIPNNMVSAAGGSDVIGGQGSLPSGGIPGEGGGIIGIETPTFVVSLCKEEFKGENAFSEEDIIPSLDKKVQLQFANHFPSSDNSIFFTQSNVTYFPDAAFSWFNEGDNELKGYKTAISKNNLSYKLRKLVTVNNIKNIWYDSLKKVINNAEDDMERKGGSRDEVGKEILSKKGKDGKTKWEVIANSADKTSACMEVWSWILKNNGKNLNENLKQYIRGNYDSKKREDNIIRACAWVDLLMTLWQLSDAKQKEVYATEINRFLEDKDQEINPSMISISTAVLVHVRPEGVDYYTYVKSFDYVEYIAGITSAYSLYKANAGSRNGESYLSSGYKEMIKAAIKDSIIQKPKLNRITNLTREAAIKKDAFNWGMAGVLGYRIKTAGNVYADSESTSVDYGAIELIKFCDKMYGFAIAYCYNNYKTTPKATLGLRVNPESTNVDSSTSIIGTDVKALVSLTPQKPDLWKKRLSETYANGFPKIEIRLERTTERKKEDGTTSTSTKVSTFTSIKNPDVTCTVPVNSISSISTSDLRIILLKENVTIDFKDATSQDKIDENETVTYRYKASGVIYLLENERVTLNSDEAESVFMRVKDTSPIPTIPSYWSEIKNGSPGNEPFEAMAGVPTTRNLYFASGGSEFIVEFSKEYKQDQTTERTYKSVFKGGVDSEFKQGDTAPNQTLGGQSVNLHGGGTYTKTWTGTTAWTGSGGVSGATAWHTDSWDDAAYNSAMAEANNFASQVNGTVLSFTSASDQKTRSKSGWSASASGSNPHNTGSHTNGQEYQAPSYDSNGKQTSPEQPFIAGTYTPGTSNSWTITVTWTVPAHCICGPCCTHVMTEDVVDTWKQKITYDYMKIKVARVWKLDKASLNGMTDITGTDEVRAEVVSGDPNIFYNKSLQNKSIDGRLRYSLEPDQHDAVIWDEGYRTNKEDGSANNGVSSLTRTSACVKNSIDRSNNSYSTIPNYHETYFDNIAKGSEEYKRFDLRRKTENTATVISDFLILQTSSGDQSIFYFDKDSVRKQSQEEFPKVSATEEEMTVNNPLSYFDQNSLPYDNINIGSYNGKYYDPRNKYSQQTGNKVVTKFDSVPAGLVRPTRPDAPMRLVKTDIDIIDELPNGFYPTGDATVFYKVILNEYDNDQNRQFSNYYHMDYNDKFMDYGHEFTSPYSENHEKINDIVIHNPVSAEYAMVLPLPAERDQRTDSTKMLGGNIQEDSVELVTRLKNPLPKQNLIWNGDAEASNSDGTLANWKTWASSASNATFTKRTTSDWRISGNSSFEITTTPNLNIHAVYYTDVPGIGGDSYSFSGKLGAHRCVGYFYIEAFNSLGTSLGSYTSDVMNNNASVKPLTINFTAPKGTSKLRVHIVNGDTSGYVAGYGEHVFADDLVLNDTTTATWQTISYETQTVSEVQNSDYVPAHTIPNPNYIPASAGVSAAFNYTGGYQTFTAPSTGTYTLEVWGAQGADGYTGNGGIDTGTYGGKGGYSKGNVSLTKNETIFIFIGGIPTESNDVPIVGGWNGGGTGNGNIGAWGGGGGGATDIRRYGSQLENRIIVAGGGGGGGHNQYGGGGGGTNGITGSAGSPVGLQTSGYALWQGGGTYNHDCGAGGGGYYGGYGSSYTDHGGSGGSGYIGGVSNGTTTAGIRSGNGYAVITAPATAAVGEPTITIPEKGKPTIKSISTQINTISQAPEDWYETVEVTIPANKPVKIGDKGTFAPGNFINLDYQFQVYFPNLGDFEGDNSYGISEPSMMRGKGFVNNMNTTEWTKEKYVKFNFNTIYNGVGYNAGEDIPLDINDLDGIYDFYCPLSNNEALSSGVEFWVIANNGTCVDNMMPANKERGSNFDAYHSGVKHAYIDIVGRIGNLIMEDTTDFRFSNLFKNPKNPITWYIPKVLKEVLPDSQNNILGSTVDIRGQKVTEVNDRLNTYGLLDFLNNKNPISFPLSPDKNNVRALQRQPLRIGYKSLQDIQTIGNYSNGMVQIIPHYYVLEMSKEKTTPVDVYMNINGKYKPINIFGAAVPGWDPRMVYNNEVTLDWEQEKQRRNYTSEEAAKTAVISDSTKILVDNGDIVGLQMPTGNNYTYGNNQIMQLNARNRTFIGTSETNGKLNNPGNTFDEMLFGLQAQRWHYSCGLPSSAVFVEHGKALTQANIDAMKTETSVVLMCLDIKAAGDTYTLQYTDSGENSNIRVAGKTFDLSYIPYPIVEIISTNRSSADDLDIRGTH